MERSLTSPTDPNRAQFKPFRLLRAIKKWFNFDLMSDHKKGNSGNIGNSGNNQTLDYGDGSFELITPTAANKGESWKTKATGDREVFAHLTKDRKPVQYAWN